MGAHQGNLVRREILYRPANIQKAEAELQEDKCVSVVVEAPNNPQDITQKEQPEAPIPFEFLL